MSETHVTISPSSPARRRAARKSGFTLVEIAVTVLIIGVLVMIALPAFAKARMRTAIMHTANDLKVFANAFEMFAMNEGSFPPDCHFPAPYHLPDNRLTEYIKVDKWMEDTPLGGNYNWEGNDAYPYVGISLFQTTATLDALRTLDETIDNGDLATGAFRLTPNNRYTYIIEE